MMRIGAVAVLALLPSLAQAQQHYRGAGSDPGQRAANGYVEAMDALSQLAREVYAPELEPLSIHDPSRTSTLELKVEPPLRVAHAPAWTLDGGDLEATVRVEAPNPPPAAEAPMPPVPPACSDGQDNDLDGETDFPEEGCDDPEDTTETQYGMRMAVLTGGSVVLSSDAQAAMAPLVRLAVDWDLAKGDRTPDMGLTADFTAEPGETINPQDPQTFRALEFGLVIRERPIKGLAAWGWAGFGFSTRLPNNPEPLIRTVRWFGGGLEFRSRRGDFLRLGLEATQLFDGFYRAATVIEGAVRLAEQSLGNLTGAVYLLGRALLGLDYASARGAPARHDVVTVSLAVGGVGGR